jgi:hypothetical protein
MQLAEQKKQQAQAKETKSIESVLNSYFQP